MGKFLLEPGEPLLEVCHDHKHVPEDVYNENRGCDQQGQTDLLFPRGLGQRDHAQKDRDRRDPGASEDDLIHVAVGLAGNGPYRLKHVPAGHDVGEADHIEHRLDTEHDHGDQPVPKFGYHGERSIDDTTDRGRVGEPEDPRIPGEQASDRYIYERETGDHHRRVEDISLLNQGGQHQKKAELQEDPPGDRGESFMFSRDQREKKCSQTDDQDPEYEGIQHI
ncbi:hypothetical protein SDC9_31493 [bioreactor metagenome]|uniref:Uncharacterized protein n=1 Tax=bioreactor metagenome TaxID=1076179 RepID=A0A644V2R7_9ZZZZ